MAAEIFQLFGEIALKGDKKVIRKLKTVDQAAKSLDETIRDIENRVRVEVDAATKKAQEEIDHLKDEIERLKKKTHTIYVTANTNAAMSAIMALGPAVIPAIASITVAAGGIGSAFAAAGVGVAAFAAIAVPALGGVFEASKEVEKIQKKIAEADTAKERAAANKELAAVMGTLTTKERAALKALQDFKSFWSGFVDSLQNPILDMFIKSLGTLQTTLTRLRPVFDASISAFSDLFAGMDKAVKGQKMQAFFDWLAVNIGPSIKNFGAAFSNVMEGVMNLIMAFGPVSGDMQTGLVGLTQKFADWTAGLSKSQGFKDFINYVKANGPTLLTTFKELITLLTQLTIAMAAVAPVVLQIVNGILKFVNYLLQLHPAVGPILIIIAGLAGVFSFLAPVVMKIIGVFGKLGPMFAKLGPQLTKIGTALRTFGTTIMNVVRSGFMSFLRVLNVLRLFFFANPFGIAIIAITALVTAGIWLYNNWSKVKTWLLSIWNSIKSTAVSVFNSVSNFISNAFQSARSRVTSIVNSIRSTVSGIWNSIKSTTSKVWSSIKTAIGDALSKAWSTVKGYASNFLSAGASLMTSLVSGIKSKVGAAVDAVKNGMAKVRSYLPFSPAKEGPLSDLDKSGESFFPTFASRMQKGLRPALGTIDDGLTQARGLISPADRVPLVAANTSPAVINYNPTFNINGVNGLPMNVVELRKLMRQIADEQFKEIQQLARAAGQRPSIVRGGTV